MACSPSQNPLDSTATTETKHHDESLLALGAGWFQEGYVPLEGTVPEDGSMFVVFRSYEAPHQTLLSFLFSHLV